MFGTLAARLGKRFLAKTGSLFLCIGLLSACGEKTIQGTISSSTSLGVFAEMKNDGTGSKVENLTIKAKDELTLYSIARDKNGAFLQNSSVFWALSGAVGNLNILPDGKSAVFSAGTSTGTNQIRLQVGGKVVSTINVTVVAAGTVSVVGPSTAPFEGDNLDFDFVLSSPNFSDVVINYSTTDNAAIDGVDYVGVGSGAITIPAGNTLVSVSILGIEDLVVEPNEDFSVQIDAVTYADVGTAVDTATIDDDDTLPAITIADATVNENDGSANIVVSLDVTYPSDVTFDYLTGAITATQGTDYTATSGTATIAAGATLFTISAPITNDMADEANETFSVTVTNPSNAWISDSSGTVTIIDEDIITNLSVADVMASEASGAVNVVISMNTANNNPVIFNYGTSSVSTNQFVGFDDYTTTTGTMTIAAGVTVVTISVPVSDDTADEIDEVFNFVISNPVNATLLDATGAVTITDNDNPPSITVSDASVNEGASASLQINRSARSEKAIVFDFATSNGTATTASGDYTAVSGTYTIAAGTATATNFTVNVPALVDATNCELAETINITISNFVNALGAPDSGVITISQDIPSISLSAAAVTEGAPFAVTANLSYSCPFDISFDWRALEGTARVGQDFTTTSGSSTFISPATSLNFNIATVNDGVSEAVETLMIYVAVSDYAVRSPGSIIQGVINDNDGVLGVAKVVTDARSTCALSADGRIRCWGSKAYGNIASGDVIVGDVSSDMGDNLPYSSLGTGVKAKKVSTTHSRTCVVTTTHQLKCFGTNGGLLGLGDSGSRGDNPGELGDDLPFVNVGTGRTVLDVATAPGATCAVLDNGGLKCWGNGFYIGQGYAAQWGSPTIGNDPSETGDGLPYVDLGTGVTAKAVYAGNNSICAITSDDRLKCFGENNFGKLGLGDTDFRGDNILEMSDALPFVDLGTGRTIKKLGLGFYHTCAVLDNDRMKCWGNNWDDRLGYGAGPARGDNPGEMGDALPFIDFSTADDQVKDMSVGYSANCAILSNDDVTCWGWSGYAQLSIPAAVNVIGAKKLFSGGHSDHCALLLDDSVYCWGFNRNGLSGGFSGGGPFNFGTGVLAKDFGYGVYNSGGSSSSGHWCVITATDDLKCWGYNAEGTLGRDDHSIGDAVNEMGSFLNDINLGTGKIAIDIAHAGDAKCVLVLGGEVRCWGSWGPSLARGDDNYGAIQGDGVNETGNSLVSINFGVGRTALRITGAGDGNFCAIMDNLDLKCWGFGWIPTHGHANNISWGHESGHVGASFVSTNIGTGVKALALVGGANTICAYTTANDVRCWGSGNDGALGQGNEDTFGYDAGTMGDNTPKINFGSAGLPVKIAGGWDFFCALFGDGRVKCWGDGDQGRTGQGSTSDWGNSANEMGDFLPYLNFNGKLVSDIWTGIRSIGACAKFTDNSVSCWGSNTYGQLGIGSFGAATAIGDTPAEMGAGLAILDLGTGRTPIQIYGSEQHKCAVLDNNSLKCWGRNNSGQLGYEDYFDRGDAPGEMGDSLPAISVGF